MKDIKHARHMLSMASKDLLALEKMKDDPVYFYDEVYGFHAQQTVEKSMKALLSYFGIKYRKIHDLGELLALLKEKDNNSPQIFHGLLDLTDYAVMFRYDDYTDSPNTLNREEIYNGVLNAYNYAKKLIEQS